MNGVLSLRGFLYRFAPLALLSVMLVTTANAAIAEPEWARVFDAHEDYIADIAPGPEGEVYALGTTSTEANHYGDVRLSRYEADGTRRWTRVFGRPGRFRRGVAAVDDPLNTDLAVLFPYITPIDRRIIDRLNAAGVTTVGQVLCLDTARPPKRIRPDLAAELVLSACAWLRKQGRVAP